MVVTIAIGDEARLELVRNPRTTFDSVGLDMLVRQLLRIVRAGFGNEGITERQVALSAIDVPYGAFIYRAGELVGSTSAWVLAVEDFPAPVLYLGGAALAPHVHGNGFYQALLLTRFAIGAVAGAACFTTRTQSPIVSRALKAYRPYPFTPGSERYQAAARAIARELDGHGPAPAPLGGLSFDERTGVMHGAYGRSLYSALPWSGDAEIDRYLEAHLSIERGDALIVVGSLRSAELDERCRRRLGFSFDDLTARVAPLVLECDPMAARVHVTEPARSER
jgi:hypothetical protein